MVDGCEVGDDTIISSFTFTDPGIKIGSRVFIGPGVKLCNDYWPRVEKEGWFDIADLTSGTVVVTKIEDGASVGAGAIVLPGITIGADAMIAAGAKVNRDVPAGHLYTDSGDIVPIDPARTPNRMRTAA
jgi:acetyltransferase-like isoleucine patch superfamily enzyme